MKSIFLFIALVVPVFSFTQELHFDLVPLMSPQPQITYDFSHSGNSEINHFDMDNDGDQDVLLCDYTEGSLYGLVKLYRNDGAGSFREIESNPFQQVERASADVADIDNDGDFDVIVIGRNVNTPLTKLYRNECGTFYADTLSIFVNYENGTAAFADIDNDNDPDLLLSGVTGFTMEPSRLYKNDGTGLFTIYNDSILPPSGWGSIDFGDIDNDGDLDLLMTGEKISGVYAELFLNDGLGNYTLTVDNFTSVYYSNAEFGDLDNDGDLDVIIIGKTGPSGTTSTTKKYLNNGTGTFTFSSNTALTNVNSGMIKYSDLDNDNDLDVVIMGNNTTGQYCKIYRNNGLGIFTFTSGESFPHWAYRGLAVFDIDNDNDVDIITVTENAIGMIHLNNGLGQFETVPLSDFQGVGYSSSDLADVDNDGDLDLLLTGELGPPGGSATNMYLNNGSGGFTEQISTPFPNMYYGDNEFADVDGDNDLDLFMTGFSDIAPSKRADLYLNNGAGSYSLSPSIFNPIAVSSCAFIDVDGDSDLDLLTLGSNATNNSETNLFINNGLGSFTEDISCAIEDLRLGSITSGDIDGDADIDVIVTGVNASSNKVSSLYLNDGNGSFTLTSSPFTAVQRGMVDMADIDGDTDLDVFFSGENGGAPYSEIFINDGFGNLTSSSSGILSLDDGNAEFVDIDNDSDMDLIYQGSGTGYLHHVISLNDGLGNFTVASTFNIGGHNYGSLSVGDVDNDNLMDLFVSGNVYGGRSSLLYRQTICSNHYSSVSISTCNSYTSPAGNIYDTTGIYIESFSGMNGCDSTITYCVNILNSGGPTYVVEVACETYSSPSGNIHTISGIYYDTIQGVSGCDSVLIIDLTVKQNSSNSIVVEDCNSYISPSGNIYTNSGIYLDTIPNFQDCDSIISIDLTINNIDNTVTQINEITLESNENGAQYQWISCVSPGIYTILASETDQSYTATSNGDFAVIVTNVNCSDTSSCITINSVEITDIQEASIIKIFPNPSNKEVTLITENFIIDRIEVYDVTGRRVLNFKGNVISIDISALSNGTYNFILYSASEIHREQFVKY